MANLIVLKENGKTLNMNEIEVHPEEDIENIIFENSLLADVVLLKRQVKTYDRESRIDIVGLDSENNILVVEIKDEIVSEDVISQVLRYALWIESYPDAIKSIWLENKNKVDFEDFPFDWDKEFKIKIVIIGPSFKPSVQKLINRITYPVDLLEFKKFSDEENDYIFLNNVIVEDEKPKKPIDTNITIDKNFYLKRYNPDTVNELWDLCTRIEEYIKEKGWELKRNNTTGYVSFKYGFFGVFGVEFRTMNHLSLFFKVTPYMLEKVEIDDINETYEEQWKQMRYDIPSGKIDLHLFDELFEKAYKNVTGRK